VWSFGDQYRAAGVLAGPPHQGIGRGFKVGKEEIAGLVVALRRYVQRDHAAERTRWERLLQAVLDGIGTLPHVQADFDGPTNRPVPRLQLTLDEAALGCTAFEVIRRLLDGTPALAVGEGRARQGVLVINPMALQEEDVDPLVSRLRAVLGGVR
jgi:L-seryl-tRNA(Ser) seleniumtransferase